MTKWLLGVLAALSLVSNGIVPVYANTGYLNQKDMKIGKLYLEEYLSDIQRQYGNPSVKTTSHGSGDAQWDYTKQGFIVIGTQAWEIDVTHSSVGSTPRGIHVGSTLQAVKRAYPNMKPGVENQLYEHDNGYMVDFMFKNGTVSGVILSLDNPSSVVHVTIDRNCGNVALGEAVRTYLLQTLDPKVFKSVEIVRVAKDNHGPMGKAEWTVTLTVHHQSGASSAFGEGKNVRIVGFTQKNGSYQVNSLATGG